jgi:hypothetical protein
MSFGPSATTKTAENQLGGISQQATNQQLPMFNAAGTTALDTGAGNINAGTNFFQTLLGGNAANTAAALQPSIDQIRQGTTGNLNAASTLMPRGGGRSAALFGQSFAPQAQIQNLFNSARTGAASALPQIGLGQQGIGTNLFGLGNQALQIGSNASGNMANVGQQQQQITNQLWQGLGSGLFNLASLFVPKPGGSGGSSVGNWQ